MKQRFRRLLMASLAVLAPMAGLGAVAVVVAPTAAHASTCDNSTSIYDDEMGSYLQAASVAAGSTPLDGVRDQGSSGAAYSEWNVCQDPSDTSLYSIQNVGTGDYVNDSQGNAVVANSGTQGYNWEISCVNGVSGDSGFTDVRSQIEEAVDSGGAPVPTGYGWVGYGTENGISGYAFGEKLVEPTHFNFDNMAIAGLCGADTSSTVTCLSGSIHITPDGTNYTGSPSSLQWNETLANAASYTPCENSTTGEWELKVLTSSYMTYASRMGGITDSGTAHQYFDFGSCGENANGYGFQIDTGADTSNSFNVYGMAPWYDITSGTQNGSVQVGGTAGGYNTMSTVFSSDTATTYTTNATSGLTVCGYV